MLSYFYEFEQVSDSVAKLIEKYTKNHENNVEDDVNVINFNIVQLISLILLVRLYAHNLKRLAAPVNHIGFQTQERVGLSSCKQRKLKCSVKREHTRQS